MSILNKIVGWSPLFLILLFVGVVVWFNKLNDFDQGVVIEKKYEPKEYIKRCEDVNSSMNDNKSNRITTFCYKISDQEDYTIVIKTKQRSRVVFKKVYIDKAYYNKLNIGDNWYRTSECKNFDDNNSKTLISSKVRAHY